MSAMRSDGFIGLEWEADRCPHRGLVPGMVNATGYLRGSVWDLARDSLEWFPFDTPAPL